MRGLFDGRPYVDLDSIVGTSFLDGDLIEQQMSRCAWVPVYFGHATDPRYKDVVFVDVDDADRAFERECHATLDTAGATIQWRKYLKLKYGAFVSSYNIHLRTPTVKYDYMNIGRGDLYASSESCSSFPTIERWLADQKIFSGIGRVSFFIQDHFLPVPIHSDVSEPGKPWALPNERDAAFEFLWLSPRLAKGFFVYDEATGVKRYVTSKVAWFNSYDKHGSDALPRMTWSLRVDGSFSDEFRRAVRALVEATPRPEI